MKCRWCGDLWEPEARVCVASTSNGEHEWEREVFVEPVVSLGAFEPNRELARRLAAEIAAEFAVAKTRDAGAEGRGDEAGAGMSEKRLYKVRAVHEYVALSDSPHEARRFARDAVRDSEPTTSAELMVQPDGTTTYPAGWDAECLVYGSKTDLTLGAALKAERERQKAALRDGGPSIPSTQPTTEPEPTLADQLTVIEKLVGGFPHPVEQTPQERAVIDRLVALLNRPASPNVASPSPAGEPTLTDHLAAVARMVHNLDVPIEQAAERAFDALCCGAKADHLPGIGANSLALTLIDLLFAKLSDAREADAIEAAGDDEPDAGATHRAP